MYVVNPGGLIVDVSDDHGAALLKASTSEKPWREASDDEAKACAAFEAGKSKAEPRARVEAQSLARTARAVTVLNSTGPLTNLTAVDSANGETIPYVGGRAFLDVSNASGGSINVTVKSSVSVDGQPATNNDRVVAVAAAARRRIGLQNPVYLQTDGNVYVDYSASASVTAEACQVQPVAAYATGSDFTSYTGQAVTSDTDRLLLRASTAIDARLVGVYYATDVSGNPTDTYQLAALKNAACAQVEYWLATGDELGLSEQYEALSIGSVVLNRGGKSAATKARTPVLAPRAIDELRLANLWPTQPVAWQVNLPGFLLVHTASVEPYLGTGAYGPQYGPSVTVKCFRDDARRLVRAQNGDEVVSETTLYCRLSENVPANSRVTIAGDPAKYNAVLVKRRDPGGLPSPAHLEVVLK